MSSADGTPREGLRVDFRAPNRAQDVTVATDAGGTFRAELEPGVVYLAGSTNPFGVGGQEFPAGTTFRVVVPAGEGDVALTDCEIGLLDLSPVALHRRLEALEAATGKPTPQPVPAPEPTPEPARPERGGAV